MPIAKKSKTKSKTTKSRSNTLHITPAEIGISEESLNKLHSVIEEKKKINSLWDSCPIKAEVLDATRKRMFGSRGGSFYIDLPHRDGMKQILVKPSSFRGSLSDAQAENIEEIIEGAGYDAGDYYHESQSITMDADTIYDRLGEDEYGTFQSDLAEFMSKRGLGDCWEMKCSIKPKPDWNESRHGLPNEVNLEIETIAPTIISIQAKRSI